MHPGVSQKLRLLSLFAALALLACVQADDPGDGGGGPSRDAGVLDGGDGGPSDGGDAGLPDAGDAGLPDAGDAGPSDGGDAGPPDDGDAGPPDDGDAGPPDDGDAGPPDDGDDGYATACAPAHPPRSGEGTYYIPVTGGACTLPAESRVLPGAALNPFDYADAALCGACLEVHGPLGLVQVQVTDLCPECLAGDVDFEPAPFEQLAEPAWGRVPITWRVIPCPVGGPVDYLVDHASSSYWAAFTVLEHRYPLRRVDWRRRDGTTVRARRSSHNTFVLEPDGDHGPYEVWLTDTRGRIVKDDVPLAPGLIVPGEAQFPPCQP